MSDGCVLQVGMVGLSHKSADLEHLEIFTNAASILKKSSSLFYPHPLIIISTCNRIEIYFGANNLSEAHSDLLTFLRPHFKSAFEHRLYSFFGIDCFFHLAKVTSGLDSAVIGESEIQGQVKQSYLQGMQTQKLTSSMHYLFQKSLKLGKNIRSKLPASEFNLADAVLQLGKMKLGSFIEKKILLIGYSKINQLILSLLKKNNGPQIFLSTRSSFQIPGCKVVSRSEIASWRKYDWVIAATDCKEPLLTAKEGSFTLLFDLAVPRNIDPSLKQDPTVLLYNIEEIHSWMREKAAYPRESSEFVENFLKSEIIKLARIYKNKILFQKNHFLIVGDFC